MTSWTNKEQKRNVHLWFENKLSIPEECTKVEVPFRTMKCDQSVKVAYEVIDMITATDFPRPLWKKSKKGEKRRKHCYSLSYVPSSNSHCSGGSSNVTSIFSHKNKSDK